MTNHPIRVGEDGERIYSNYTRYTPLSDEERVYTRRKPAEPGAVRRGGVWFLPLALEPPDARQMPETRADSEAYDHMTKPRRCKCDVCKRPMAAKWQAKWRKDNRPRS